MTAHPATGSYADLSAGVPLSLYLHVDNSGRLTGELRTPSGRRYLEGQFSNGRAEGRLFDHGPIEVSFVLSLEQDVISFNSYPGTVGRPPANLDAPRYLLRQPAAGPTTAVPAPLRVLVKLGRDEAVLAEGDGHGFQLRDARRFVELLLLALAEGGYDAGFPGEQYLFWLERAALTFSDAAPQTQALLATSETYWPPIAVGWGGAAEAARTKVAADVLLLAFGADTVAGWVAAAAAFDHRDEPAACSSLQSCVLNVIDVSVLAEAAARAPCFSLVSASAAPPANCVR